MLAFDKAVVAVGMGCFVVASGVYDAIRARGKRSWAVVEAEIIDSQIVNRGTNFVTNWQAQVRYRYRVGEVQYERDSMSMTGSGTAGNFRWQAEREAMRFPLGARVRVQVSPEDPAFSVLESQEMRHVYGSYATIVIGVLITAYGIYGLAA